MTNIVDLDKERRIQALINAIAAKSERNPEYGARTMAMLNRGLPTVDRDWETYYACGYKGLPIKCVCD